VGGKLHRNFRAAAATAAEAGAVAAAEAGRRRRGGGGGDFCCVQLHQGCNLFAVLDTLQYLEELTGGVLPTVASTVAEAAAAVEEEEEEEVVVVEEEEADEMTEEKAVDGKEGCSVFLSVCLSVCPYTPHSIPPSHTSFPPPSLPLEKKKHSGEHNL